MNLRPLVTADREELLAGVNLVFRQDRTPAMEQCYPALFAPANLENWLGAFVGGTLVGAVGTLLKTVISTALGEIRVGLVGSVYTVPEQRGKGVASNLIRTMFQLLKNRREVELVMISGNRSLYRRHGAVGTGQFLRATFPVIEVVPAEIEIVGFLPQMAEQLVGFYAKKPAHFRRTAEELVDLVATGLVEDVPAEFVVVARSGNPVAYLAFERIGSTARIRESAGNTGAIWTAFSLLAKERGIETIDWMGDSPDAAVTKFLTRQGVHVRHEDCAGTLLLLQAERIWQRLKAFGGHSGGNIERRWKEIELALPSESEDNARTVCNLFFGSYAENVIKECFVPLPRLGLNFI